jgi:hypothetical protein
MCHGRQGDVDGFGWWRQDFTLWTIALGGSQIIVLAKKTR